MSIRPFTENNRLKPASKSTLRTFTEKKLRGHRLRYWLARGFISVSVHIIFLLQSLEVNLTSSMK